MMTALALLLVLSVLGNSSCAPQVIALHVEKTALAGAVQRLGFFFLPMPLPCLNCFSLPSGLQRLFERRNWTPQAMLYLKGARKSQTLHSLHRSDGRHPGIPDATEQEPGERVLHLAPENSWDLIQSRNGRRGQAGRRKMPRYPERLH